MKSLILAAGKGVRLKPLTDSLPKAMVLLKGKPLLEHVLLSLKGAGITDAIIVVGYLKEKIISHFGDSFQGMKISFVEQKKQLGTAHAIASAESKLKGQDFLCTHADVIAESFIFSKLAGMEKKGLDAIAVGKKVENPERFGVFEIKNEKLVRIVEKPAKGKAPSNMINQAIYWFSEKVFEEIKAIKKSARGELEIVDALNNIAKKGKVGFVEYSGKITDIGSLEDLKKAEED